MAKIRKGAKLVCVLCGRRIVVTSSGISRTNIWCCRVVNPMLPAAEAEKKLRKAAAKPAKKKSAKKKATRKKVVKKKAVRKTARKKAAPKKRKKAKKK